MVCYFEALYSTTAFLLPFDGRRPVEAPPRPSSSCRPALKSFQFPDIHTARRKAYRATSTTCWVYVRLSNSSFLAYLVPNSDFVLDKIKKWTCLLLRGPAHDYCVYSIGATMSKNGNLCYYMVRTRCDRGRCVWATRSIFKVLHVIASLMSTYPAV